MCVCVCTCTEKVCMLWLSHSLGEQVCAGTGSVVIILVVLLEASAAESVQPHAVCLQCCINRVPPLSARQHVWVAILWR